MKKYFFIILFFYLITPSLSFADEIYLINNDKLSGEIVKETDKEVILFSPILGDVLIKREKIREIVTEKGGESLNVKKSKKNLWKKELSIGYNLSRGNTEQSQSSVMFFANRKTKYNELTLKGESFYSSKDKKMDSQRWNAFTRYAFSFGESLKAYNFYRFEADHDRFADIDYRLTPFTGIGYWFFDKEEFKLMAEAGIGFEHTIFRSDKKDKNDAILVPRVFFEKKLFGQLTFSQDIFMYAPFSDIGGYRVHLETIFTNPIDENFSLKVRLIDDFDPKPSAGTKKNDLRLISSLVYSF